MAKKIFTLPWTMKELKTFTDGIVNAFSGSFLAWLNRMRTRPFVIVVDEKDKCKRVFMTKEDADKWFAERDSEEGLSAETTALEFANIDGNGTIPGSEQYQLNVNVVNDGSSFTIDKTEALLMFNFSTVDRLNESVLGEAVEIAFTFSNPTTGTKKASAFFNYSTEVTKFDVRKYLEEGDNDIVMIVRGRSTGLSRTIRCVFTLIDIQLTSDFNIAKAQQERQNIQIPYYCKGPDAKVLHIYVDGQEYDQVPVAEGEIKEIYSMTNNFAIGYHTLQMQASMVRAGVTYKSNLLFFGFINNGAGLELTIALIKAVFPSEQSIFMQSNPGLIGEQYINYTLEWAYFSTQYTRSVVRWKTKINGIESTVNSQELDEKEGTMDVMPDPIEFQPDQVGTYDIYATIPELEEPIGKFTINVKANSAGLSEKTNGLELKLTGLGRSNQEPADTRSDWSNNGFRTKFNAAMDFSAVAGYTGRAVRFDGGATGVNDCKPFAEENNVLINGMAMIFHFRTRNVVDENIPLVEIGTPNSNDAYFAIYGKKVVLQPSMGESLEYAFASEEDTHLAFVVYPKETGTDKQMMFFILNGVQAPGKQYSSSGYFTIGSYADKNSDYGKIHFGTTSKEAAIDIYNVYSYLGTISMWNGMNTYIINHGGDVATLMYKNNIFRNNAIDTPNTDAIKARFRTVEVIGDLGSLESATKKVSFWGSFIYNDPQNPKMNFYRTDGRVNFETAGQSRVSDLMAKSFHVNFDDDTAVKTYQDGKLTHKNRVIFAEGNVPENAVRIDLCGADSSICRTASHFKMVNKIYPHITMSGTLADKEYPYPLRTPAMQYAMEQYPKDMVTKWGGKEEDYQFPHDICIAPDSVPVVILWHKTENDALQVYGIGTMMQEKKAAYANGNHSIYLKERLADGTLDPYDRYLGENGDRGWDNNGTIEMEYLRADNFTENKSAEGWSIIERVDSYDADGNVIATEYLPRYEQAFEVCFPKNSDFKKDPTLKDWTWQTFYDEYVEPLARICKDQTTFDREIENVIWMPSFAMYYNKCLDKKCADSLCRNMHVLRCFIKGKWVWFAKWWDVDVQTGLFQSGAYGVDPATDRQTKDSRGEYVMSGHDVLLWNRLEQNALFKQWCYQLADVSYNTGWTCEAEKAEQDAIVESFCEGLYNLDGLQKYLSAWRKGNNYMVRMQGSSVPYRHGFLVDSYAIREAAYAIGDYGKRTVEFRATGATPTDKSIRVKSSQKWWYGIGLGETKYSTGIIKQPSDGVFSLAFPESYTNALSREFIKIFGADKMLMIDTSDFLYRYSDNLNVGNLTDAEELYVGYPTKAAMEASEGFNPLVGSISFNGLGNIKRLKKFSIMGLTGMQSITSRDVETDAVVGIEVFTMLTHFYAAATGLLSFKPASGAKLQEVWLPDCIEEIQCTKNELNGLQFFRTIDERHTIEQCGCPTSLRTLSFSAMGDDAGTHSLVSSWLKMVRDNKLEKVVNITYRGIDWRGISKADILTLASITHRNLSGYVFCNDEYSVTEMKTLTEAFGDCFNYQNTSNTLVCDCNGSGITISAVGDTVEVLEDGKFSVEQGNVVRLTGAGFPISGSNAKNYRWRVWVDNEWLMGSDDDPVVSFEEMTLNSLTGELSGNESSRNTFIYRISCLDVVSRANGETSVTVVPRTYPNSVSVSLINSQQTTSVIDGVIQVTSVGALAFGAKHVPEVFTGTMKNYKWNVEGIEDGMTFTNDNLSLRLSISKLPQDDANITIKYRSEWKDNQTTLTAEDVKVAVMTIIAQLLINDTTDGNDVLFRAFELAGVAHADPNFYNSLEVKTLFGKFSVKELLGNDSVNLIKLTAGKYYIPQYMKNVDVFDFSETGLSGNVTFDATKTPWARTINLEGTHAKIKF